MLEAGERTIPLKKKRMRLRN